MVPIGWERSSNLWLTTQTQNPNEKSPRDEDWVNDWFGGMEISGEKGSQNNNSHTLHPRFATPPTSGSINPVNPKSVSLSDSAIPRRQSLGQRDDVQVVVIPSRAPRVIDASASPRSSGHYEVRNSDSHRRKTRSESPAPTGPSVRSGSSPSPTSRLLLPPFGPNSNFQGQTSHLLSSSPTRLITPAGQYHSSPLTNSYGQNSTKTNRKSSPRQGNNGNGSPRTGGNSPRTASPRNNGNQQGQGAKTSPRQVNSGSNNARVSPRGQVPKLASPPKQHNKNRSRGSFTQGKKEAELSRFEIDLTKVISGEELRTSLMIKNIPNKYNQEMLLEAVNENHKGTFDFFYLPIDFKNKCNVGYAFVNFIDPQSIPTFFDDFNCKKWSKFNSSKVCKITYARIQGKLSFVEHFRNSSLMHEDPKCRPLIFHTHGPQLGLPKPFPLPTTLTQPSRPAEDLEVVSSSTVSEEHNSQESCEAKNTFVL